MVNREYLKQLNERKIALQKIQGLRKLQRKGLINRQQMYEQREPLEKKYSLHLKERKLLVRELRKEKTKEKIGRAVEKFESWGRQKSSTRLGVTRVPLRIARGGHQFGSNPVKKKVRNLLESDYVFG